MEMREEMNPAPICSLCKIRECGRADEPPGPVSYFSRCGTCMGLSGYREHSHTYYPSPAQVAAGTFKAGHSWRTLISLRPLWEDGAHVGYRCAEFDRCGWEERFTAEDMEPCPVHTRFPDHPVLKGVCRNRREHRPGEFDARGHITEHGREREQLRSDAANWDPGRYVDRTPRD